MPRKGLDMNIINEVIRLKNLKHSKSTTAKILGINRRTVIKYWNSDDKNPENKITENLNSKPDWFLKLNHEYLKSEIEKGVSQKILYEELSLDHKLPTTYQGFNKILKKYLLPETNKKEITIKIQRTPGYSTEIDYSGNSIPIINPSTGELIKTELFVAALSYSSYMYAEFTYSQKLEDFLRSHVNTFNFFGGLTDFIIVDNLKSGVTTAHNFEPVINRSYQDLCNHYGIVVDPARVRKPKDKPVVEKAVDIIQKDFFPRVRNKTYTSLLDLNSDLKNFLITKNKMIMKDRGESRHFFYIKEKDFFKRLPKDEYEIFYFKKAKVHPDCHIQFKKNFYSVPFIHVGEEVTVKFNSKTIHILKDSQVIATHTLRIGSNQYSTKTEHYPEKKLVETNYILNSLFKEADKVGVSTKKLVAYLTTEQRHPLKNLRKVQSVLSLLKKHGAESLEYACEQSLRFEKFSYYFIKGCCETFNKKTKGESKMKNNNLRTPPQRQQEFVCLQGGKLQ